MKPPRYITDAEGKRVEVVVSLEEYEQLIEAFEEVIDIQESVKVLKEMEQTGEKPVPFEQVVKDLGWDQLPEIASETKSDEPHGRKASA
jgi:hypothetical protein